MKQKRLFQSTMLFYFSIQSFLSFGSYWKRSPRGIEKKNVYNLNFKQINEIFPFFYKNLFAIGRTSASLVNKGDWVKTWKRIYFFASKLWNWFWIIGKYRINLLIFPLSFICAHTNWLFTQTFAQTIIWSVWVIFLYVCY